MIKFKINKEAVAAVLMAGAILLTGCGKKDNSNVEQRINSMITNNTSFNDILDSVSDTTTLDERLNELGYENALNNYKVARAACDLPKINSALAELGNIILKATIIDVLNISPSDILEYNIYKETHKGWDLDYDVAYCDISYKRKVDEIVPGNINTDYYETIDKTFELSSEAEDLFFNIINAEIHSINSLEYADRVFEALERYLLTSTKLEKNKIIVDYDEEKIEQFKKTR